MKIVRIENSDEKANIVRDVLLDLPEWFGLPDSTQSYIEESKDLPLWAAEKDEDYIGFLTLKETSEHTAEIHCMGVKKKYHGQGIGTQLQDKLEHDIKGQFLYLQVKTVEEGHYDEYDATNCFYRSVGFVPLEVFPTLWDEWNPCQVMVKYIG